MRIASGASAIDISASGMRAQRLRMELVANNLANVETTSSREEVRRTADGQPYTRHTPYRRRLAVFREGVDTARGRAPGVTLAKVVEDAAPFRMEHNPGHPHAVPADSGEADAGMLYAPNVHPILEMVDMIAASRAYEANLTAVDTAKAMSASALRILA
jgi:flagellar basal-body rod protein FlgC